MLKHEQLERHYSPQEAAMILGVSPNWVAEKCRSGALRHIALSSGVKQKRFQRRIPESALREFQAAVSKLAQQERNAEILAMVKGKKIGPRGPLQFG